METRDAKPLIWAKIEPSGMSLTFDVMLPIFSEYPQSIRKTSSSMDFKLVTFPHFKLYLLLTEARAQLLLSSWKK